MIREPVTGRAVSVVDFADLRAGDQITVQIDDWRAPIEWDITIIAVDQVLLHWPREVWITGIHQSVRCRVLVRATA